MWAIGEKHMNNYMFKYVNYNSKECPNPDIIRLPMSNIS